MLNLCNKHTLKSALLTNATETVRKQKDTNKFDRKTLSVKFLSPLTDPHPRVCFRGTGQKIKTSQFLPQSTQNSVNLCESHE